MTFREPLPYPALSEDNSIEEYLGYANRYNGKPNDYGVKDSDDGRNVIIIDDVSSPTAFEKDIVAFNKSATTSKTTDKYIESRIIPLPADIYISQEIFRELVEICDTGELLISEGLDTISFSEELRQFITLYRERALIAIANFYNHASATSDLIAEILIVLGKVKEPFSYGSRYELLLKGLNSESATIRLGASKGLAALSEFLALPAVETAITNEQDVVLQHALKQLAAHLKPISKK